MSIIKKLHNLYTEYHTFREEAIEQSNRTLHSAMVTQYAEYIKKTKINKKLIMYMSYGGRGVTDSPYAFFLYFLNNEQYSDYHHVWVLDSLKNYESVIHDYKAYNNVEFVELNSDAYIKCLSTAKYLINNVTFPSYFCKRDGQVYINTWHGTPLKNMGFDMPNGRIEAANVMRNFLISDYLLSANSIMTDMYLKSHLLKGIYLGKIIEEGYPRTDLISHNSGRSSIIKKIRELGCDVDADKEIILFAPTWRGINSKAVNNAYELLDFKKQLESKIDTEKYQVLIKPHQMVYKKLKSNAIKKQMVPPSIDTDEILSVTDVLITDYSSIFIDYLLTGKPILFYMPDLDEYTSERGVNHLMNRLPGPELTTIDSIAEYLRDLKNASGEKSITYDASNYDYCKNLLCGHDDGAVTARIVDIIFNHNSGNIIDCSSDKKKILISGSRVLNNGITHSLVSLLNQMDYDEWDVTVYLNIDKCDQEDRIILGLVNDIDHKARVLVRSGRMISTVKDILNRQLVLQHSCNSIYKKLFSRDLYKQEWKRCFGDVGFDYIVDFSGYSSLLTPVLLEGHAKTHSIWLHSDIRADMNRTVKGTKPLYNNLNFIKSLYPRFDNLVSCGSMVCEVNRNKVGTEDTVEKFTYAKNTLNQKRIEQCLNEENVITIGERQFLVREDTEDSSFGCWMNLVELPKEDEITFVTVGRISTEKNHFALIDAFKRFNDIYKNSKLYICGDGPLMSGLKKKVEKSGLENSVILPGNVSNPFSIMKRCSCFVLPSLHEGQPLVLLEARACQLPIIVTDFSTVKDSLVEDGQLMIGKDKDSIFDGLCAFAEGKVPYKHFSIENYNHEAYMEFIKAIQ